MTSSIPSCVIFTKHIYVKETGHCILDIVTTNLKYNDNGPYVEGDLQYFKRIQNHNLSLKKITIRSDFKDVEVAYSYDPQENITYISF